MYLDLERRRQQAGWKNPYNKEFHNLYSWQNITMMTMSKTTRKVKHVARMENTENVENIHNICRIF